MFFNFNSSLVRTSQNLKGVKGSKANRQATTKLSVELLEDRLAPAHLSVSGNGLGHWSFTSTGLNGNPIQSYDFAYRRG